MLRLIKLLEFQVLYHYNTGSNCTEVILFIFFSVADQTPTPTRFIRNCEEVGLFQDLQNVNPFEETFRKAVEAVKTGVGPLHEVLLLLNSLSR